MTYPVLISTASFQAVTAHELRDYLRGDDGDSDDVLNFYIKTATEYLEIASKRNIIRKRYLVEFEHCAKLSVRLPMGHVDSLVIIEADGTLQNINHYSLKGDTLMLPNYHASLKVTYDVGFADSASVPNIYKIAILACSSDLFIHRFTTNDSTQTIRNNMTQHYCGLLRNYDL